MITQETASSIWSAYQEIAAAEKILADMKAEREKPFADRDKYVNPELAESVVRAYIAKKKVELVEANERARIEIELKDTQCLTPLNQPH